VDDSEYSCSVIKYNQSFAKNVPHEDSPVYSTSDFFNFFDFSSGEARQLLGINELFDPRNLRCRPRQNQDSIKYAFRC
jgi:hypothetical protein